jgi:hypothetical protein
MAGAATVVTSLTVTGLADDVILTNTKVVTVPVAQQGGYTVLATAGTTALQLFAMVDHIALAKIFLVYIRAVVGTVYILVDTAGTTTFSAAAADLVLNEGAACILPINPAGNLGLCIDGSAVTAAIKWHILGQT